MSKWTRVNYGCDTNPGTWDTGNGAIKTVCENPAYPGVERVTVSSYCGRTSDNGRYYRLADEPSRTFATLQQAARAVRELSRR